MRQRLHTGCSCNRCASGKTKRVRAQFHRMMRRFYKRQLKKDGDITKTDKSIGWTD